MCRFFVEQMESESDNEDTSSEDEYSYEIKVAAEHIMFHEQMILYTETLREMLQKKKNLKRLFKNLNPRQ